MLKLEKAIGHLFKITALIVSTFMFLGFAPTHQNAIDSLLIEGHRHEFKQEYESAKKIYKKILKHDPDKAEALMGLGRIAIAAEQWHQALFKFDKALADNRHLLENHYYLGICFRETGKAKAWILQKLDFRQSEKHFKYVLEHDSLYQDVLYQFALLWRYRDEYETAIQNCQAQICLKPHLYAPQLKLYRFYRYLITHRSQEDSYAWLKQHSGKLSDYFWGEKLRREDRLSDADSVLHELLENPTHLPVQPILLCLAKIAYQRNMPETAEQYFWRAVNHIQNRLDADLVFEELKYIVTQREYQEYDSLNSANQFRDFFRIFWYERNPVPSFESNLRLTEHFRRLIYSEKHYEYDGFRLWSDNPDKLQELEFPDTHELNQEFNDRGLIFIRHGEPDKRIATVESDLPTMNPGYIMPLPNFPN